MIGFRFRPRVRPGLAVAAASVAAVSLLVCPATRQADAMVRLADSTSGSSFTASETITRDHLVSGQDQVVDNRNVTVSVDETTNLRERQEIHVSWTGAHPTGALAADQNGQLGAYQEYPVVLMECRGIDSATAPTGQQLSPNTCWTQTPAERTQSDYVNPFPPYRLDRYSSPSDRAAQVGVPSPLPSGCLSYGGGVQHWVPFDAEDGTAYPTGPQGCAGLPPEAANASQSLEPANTTYGVADLQGNGGANFVVNTELSNASLGCSDTVPCSLVVIPIMGLSCDVAGAAPGVPAADVPSASQQAQDFALCSSTGNFQPGQLSNGFTDQEALAVSGLLWWSASNWRNRISVPLTFAPAPNVCNLSNSSVPLYLYGSEFMAQATQQWQPAFCLNPSLFKFQHVLSSEPEAKNLLTNGTIEAAIQAEPPSIPFTTPTVQAPIGLTGFSVSYDIDGKDRQPYPNLKLTPRLLAKLLTESYPVVPAIRNTYPALQNNPLNITLDPEFQALNPGIPQSIFYTAAAATMFAVSSDSDAISALTAYINADPAARSWLDGNADPWGMVVNPNYKGIQLPVSNWPLLDTFEEGAAYLSENNPCLATSPTPFLPLVAAPTSQYQTVSLYMQFAVSPSQINCAGSTPQDMKLVAVGPETPGQRFLIGITPLGDAVRYRMGTAALQTQVSPTAPTKFADGSGRTFVAPTDASLTAAADLLQPDSTVGTWTLPYADFQTDSAASVAYPGTVLMSADVPTKGLPSLDAGEYATLLNFAAGPGQIPGVGQGELPPGFVPMTAANGLGAEVAYTTAAAAAVKAQDGTVPLLVPSTQPLTKPPASGSTSTTLTGSGSSSSAPVSYDSTGSPTTDTGSATGSSGSASASKSAGNQPVARIEPAAARGRTMAIGAGFGGLAVPLALLLAVLIGGVAAGLALWSRRGTLR